MTPAVLCAWAACTRMAVAEEDGWAHCDRHLRTHRLQKAEEQRAQVRQERLAARGKPISFREAVVRLHADGYTDSEISAQLLVAPTSVRTERHRAGLAPNGHRFSSGSDELLPCGTHAAFNRHKTAGQEPCEPCRIGERVYQRNRARERRAKAAA